MENVHVFPFEGKEIRKAWHNEEWYFSVVDVIEILTDSKDPQQYWKRLNQRDPELKGAVQIVPLLIATSGGKQKTDWRQFNASIGRARRHGSPAPALPRRT